MGDETHQFGRYQLRWKHAVDAARLDCILRHAGDASRIGRLGKSDSARMLNRLDTDRAVRVRAGQDDPHSARSAVTRQRLEERVHRHMRLPALGAGVEMNVAVHDRERHIGRNHIDVISRGLYTLASLEHPQLRFTSQDLWQKTLMTTIEVRNDNERGAQARGQSLEEVAKRFQAACGGTDADERD